MADARSVVGQVMRQLQNALDDDNPSNLLWLARQFVAQREADQIEDNADALYSYTINLCSFVSAPEGEAQSAEERNLRVLLHCGLAAPILTGWLIGEGAVYDGDDGPGGFGVWRERQ